MDIFKGEDNPFVLFQRDLVSGWHSLTLVQYCTCTCISQTALRSKIFLLFSGKDWATSNLNDNLHVHALYFTYWPLFVLFWQLVVDSLMNTFFIPIEHTHHSNDYSNRGMECYFAMNNIVFWHRWFCLSMAIVLLNVTFSLMIIRRCYWFSFSVIDCQLRTFKCPKDALACSLTLLNVYKHANYALECSCGVNEVFLGVIECIFALLILHFAKMNIFCA